MTTEQEEAIERLNRIITTKFNNDYSIDSSDKEAIETVLNMLKEKDKEITDLKQALARNIAKNFTSSMKESAKSKDDLEMLNKGWQIELEKKNKQIDLMAEYIVSLDIEEDICIKNKTNPDWCNEDYTNCKNCIKQYFERKSEEC